MLKSKQLRTKKINQVNPFDLAMMVLSVISLGLVISLAFLENDSETYRMLLYIDTGICVIFLSRFFYGLYKARNKTYYFKMHWIDLVASIPAIEQLRIARVFQILRVIRVIKISHSILLPLLKQKSQTTLASLLLALVLILGISSVSILIVEGGVDGANITTAEQAIWWALVTISTVGYGDYYPVTTLGHVIGGVVIISGVSFFGVMSGYMASVFITPDNEERNEEQQEAIKFELDKALQRMEENQHRMQQNQEALIAEMTALKQELQQTIKQKKGD